MNQAKKKKPAKTYAYFIHEMQSGKNEGDLVVKRYGTVNDDDEIFESKKSPSEISIQQQLYNKGLIGISNLTGLDYYAETIEYGRQGGKAKRIWTEEAEKQRAKRAKKNWLTGKDLTDDEKALLTKAGLIKPENKEPIKTISKRITAYKYHADQAASPKERKARWKTKQAQIKARQQAEKAEADWLLNKL